MKRPLIVGNWKAHKDLIQAKSWTEEFSRLWPEEGVGAEVIITPAFIHLPLFKDFIAQKNLPWKLAAQDLSSYPSGAYTGQISAEMLSGLVDYVLLGHSERRNYFQESGGMLKKKVEQAVKFHLQPIYCVSEAKMLVPEGVEIVAYEPLFAIGSGQPDTPENASQVAEEIKKGRGVKVLYGGSVKPENAYSFLSQPNLDGLMVGGASLKAWEFWEIIKNVV